MAVERNCLILINRIAWDSQIQQHRSRASRLIDLDIHLLSHNLHCVMIYRVDHLK